MLALLLAIACTRPAEDTGIDDEVWDATPLRDKCFGDVGDPANGLPDYDQFGINVGHHCSGTDHQDITGIEKVVFLGDSITTGTPPTLEHEFYRTRLTAALEERFGALETADCSAWGRRADDLLLEPHADILACFGEPEPKTTLVVLTVGGNDMFAFAEDMAAGASAEDVMADVLATTELFSDAIHWFRDNEATHFPGGVYVIFGNVYEFTDGEGDLDVCPTAELFGFEGTIPELRDAYIAINEAWVRIARETDTDVIFLLEQFCGHGYHAGEPDNECFRGADAEVWFDLTCIHPTPAGHAEIARMFEDVIDE